MELFPEFEGGKQQVGSEAEVGSEAKVGISIKGEKDQSVKDLWHFFGLGCTFSDFFFF